MAHKNASNNSYGIIGRTGFVSDLIENQDHFHFTVFAVKTDTSKEFFM